MNETSVLIEDLIKPPCSHACPAGVDVPRYIRAVRQGQYDEALAVIREKLPLPTVCADACFAPCEEACAYRQFGDPIAIRAIKRAAVDQGGTLWKKRKKVAAKTGRKVAVVGAGPAGLSAAYYLVTQGHEVTMFDLFPEPGGTLRYGIPLYRIPRERLDRDIKEILELGVRFKGNTPIGQAIPLEKLKEDFEALFLATGASRSLKIQLKGEEKNGVLWGLDFLREVGQGKAFDFQGQEIIVIGGGNVALDVALTARRFGAGTVHLFCLEKRAEMPAHPWEMDRAEEEDILIHPGWGPKEILGRERAAGLVLVKCLSVYDENGRFSPVFDEDTTLKVEGNYIILAVGQISDLSYLQELSQIKTPGNLIPVNHEDCSSEIKGIFAGGDVVSGPDSIINAMAQGRKAASAIDRYLGGDGKIEETLACPEKSVLLKACPTEAKPRNRMPLLKSWERKAGFDQVELGLTAEQVQSESSRCLYCDARSFEINLNTDFCKECGYCAEVCTLGVFGPAEFFNEKGYRPAVVRSSDWCVGCYKCFFVCPDFAIDVSEIRSEERKGI